MKVISHRGWWIDPNEKNTVESFERSFSAGFGTETDVRDNGRGEIVISHDPPRGSELLLSNFLTIANNYEISSPIALNVKSDGLAKQIQTEISKYKHLDFFVFDMSVPDMRSYLTQSLPVYARLSEVEQTIVWPELISGIWLDSFEIEWYGHSDLSNLLESHKVCVVSSELHKRTPDKLWEMLKDFSKHQNLTLCTDTPLEASIFLGLEKNK
jgi:glycerophosphoryl diester phosphodiesterase